MYWFVILWPSLSLSPPLPPPLPFPVQLHVYQHPPYERKDFLCLPDASTSGLPRWLQPSSLSPYVRRAAFFPSPPPYPLTCSVSDYIVVWRRARNTGNSIYGNINDTQMVNYFLYVERSRLLLDVQLQFQLIQPGGHAGWELWIACVCHHVKNG